MSHFTYNNEKSSSLFQGDVLRKTSEINEIIAKVHPHYLKDDYKYFIVLTQSCDLIRRSNGKCSSPYISIAAIRPLELLLQREVAKFQKSDLELDGSICCNENRRDCFQFLERLLNNNEPEYFFLSEDSSLDFSENCVAFLKLSIALKSGLHYDKCLKAKLLELSVEFRTKLGWLVGQMYSRVGTPDWVPDTIPNKSQFDKKINGILDEYFIWTTDEKITKAKKQLKNLNITSKEEIRNIITQIKIPDKKEIISNRIKKLAEDKDLISDETIRTKLANRIINDPVIASYIK